MHEPECIASTKTCHGRRKFTQTVSVGHADSGLEFAQRNMYKVDAANSCFLFESAEIAGPCRELTSMNAQSGKASGNTIEKQLKGQAQAALLRRQAEPRSC